MYFDQKLCFFHVDETDQEQILTMMANKMHEIGVVKNSYLNGILKREKEYPTGLLINEFGFALPHTDSIHVNESQICFCSLKQPIIFNNMVDQNQKVPVRFIFMLAMKQPHEQLENLQNLIALFQSEKYVNELLDCRTVENFIRILALAGVN
ncbi:PTS sugar transporter subunit IIA [Orbaceae bacterium ac157xtp]